MGSSSLWLGRTKNFLNPYFSRSKLDYALPRWCHMHCTKNRKMWPLPPPPNKFHDPVAGITWISAFWHAFLSITRLKIARLFLTYPSIVRVNKWHFYRPSSYNRLTSHLPPPLRCFHQRFLRMCRRPASCSCRMALEMGTRNGEPGTGRTGSLIIRKTGTRGTEKPRLWNRVPRTCGDPLECISDTWSRNRNPGT